MPGRHGQLPARPFYEKQGYQLQMSLQDYPYPHAASLSDESALGPASIEIHRPVALRLPGLHVLRR